MIGYGVLSTNDAQRDYNSQGSNHMSDIVLRLMHRGKTGYSNRKNDMVLRQMNRERIDYRK